jgi:hypothetical protein
VNCYRYPRRVVVLKRPIFPSPKVNLVGSKSDEATTRYSGTSLARQFPGAPMQDDLVRDIYGMPLVTNPGSMIGDGYSNIAFSFLALSSNGPQDNQSTPIFASVCLLRWE